MKPIDEPSKRFLRRIGWCNDPLPNVCVDIFVPRFSQSWRIWHTLGSLRRCNGKGPQSARPQMFGHSGEWSEYGRHMSTEPCVNCRCVARIRNEGHVYVSGALEPFERDVHTGCGPGSCQR